jgi:hypothetical protein
MEIERRCPKYSGYTIKNTYRMIEIEIHKEEIANET